MRLNGIFKAYLDDFNLVRVYISKNFYNGTSKKFFLVTDNYFEEIRTKSSCDLGSHFLYEFFVDTIDLTKEYEIMTYHGRRTPLLIGTITKQARFDDLYYYDGPLGAVYKPTHTDFYLYSPTGVSCSVVIDNKYYAMERDYYGFHVKIDGDLDGKLYNYFLRQNGAYHMITDPYGYSANANHTKSAVINLEKIKINDYRAKINSYTDAVIYEMSVRDFTIDNSSHIKNKNLFLGVVEDTEETRKFNTGYNYLKYLGITHVQLLPVLDFASVDELHKKETYNWGYDTFGFFTLEGSYSTDPNDPYSRLNEFSEMINQLHAADIAVNLDIVSNHVFDVDKHPLNIAVPNYYFILDKNNNYQSTSGCGNDFDSRGKMAKRLLIDQALFLARVYKIDGIRYDLMGVFTFDVINEIKERLKLYYPNFMVYGEGWDLGGVIPSSERAIIANASKMNKIAFFNDVYRDTLKGKTMESNSRGFFTGNNDLYFKAINCYLSNTTEFDGRILFDQVDKSLNYVECHDNQTLYDKVSTLYSKEIDCYHNIKLINSFLLLSTGICFIHAGQEFMRTKNRFDNTYDLSDIINKFDYARRDANMTMVNYVRDLIELRKNNLELRTCDKAMLSKYRFEKIDKRLLRFDLEDLIIIFNMSDNKYDFSLNTTVSYIFNDGKVDEKTKQVSVKPYSVAIYRK